MPNSVFISPLGAAGLQNTLNKQVLFNNAGAIGGFAGLEFDTATSILDVPGNVRIPVVGGGNVTGVGVFGWGNPLVAAFGKDDSAHVILSVDGTTGIGKYAVDLWAIGFIAANDNVSKVGIDATVARRGILISDDSNIRWLPDSNINSTPLALTWCDVNGDLNLFATRSAGSAARNIYCRGILASASNGSATCYLDGSSTYKGLVLASDKMIRWTATSSYNTTVDAEFARSGVSIVKLTNGGAGYGTLDVLGLKASGVAGVSFGPAHPASITIVNGIVTACS